MTFYDSISAITTPPTAGQWCIGGTGYGVEALVMPFTGSRLRRPSATPAETAALRRSGEALQMMVESPEVVPRNDAVDSSLASWARWINGHQLTFIAWRLAREVRDAFKAKLIGPHQAAHLLAACVDAYSRLLVYSGSCSISDYHQIIRPAMYRHNPAFSGTWAADYAPIRDVLRMNPESMVELGPNAMLHRVLSDNRAVHEYIANRLVPDGVSLLQQAHHVPLGQSRVVRNGAYDLFFMTARSQISGQELLAALLRRANDLLLDVSLSADSFERNFTDSDAPPYPLQLIAGLPTSLVQLVHVGKALGWLDDVTSVQGSTAVEEKD